MKEVSAIITRLCKEFGARLVSGNRGTKNRPLIFSGASWLWFSLLRRGVLAAWTAGAARADAPLGGGLRAYGRSAPVEETSLWGNGVSWAAKLFSINRTCTVLLRMRASSVEDAALPRATMCMR